MAQATKKTVTQLLDLLAADQMTVTQVAEEFRNRKWREPKRATDAQAWGAADDDAPDPDSWDAVNADSRLTPDEYVQLSQAYKAARAAK